MLRSKLLVKTFVNSNHILPMCKLSPSTLMPDVAPFSCLPCQKHLPEIRNDYEGLKKLQFNVKTPVVGAGEKCFSKLSGLKCWSCEKHLEVKNFACLSCGALQHPKKNLNYFELFGLSQTFDVNLEDLSKRYKKLQTIFHPDKFAGKTQAEKDISETYSKLVNKAYSTLKDPFLRGTYLLELQKYPDCNAPVEQEFLITVMQKNEELEFLNNQSQLNRFLDSIKFETKEYSKLINQAFRSGSLPEVKYYLSKLKYYISMDNRAREKLNTLIEKKNY